MWHSKIKPQPINIHPASASKQQSPPLILQHSTCMSGAAHPLSIIFHYRIHPPLCPLPLSSSSVFLSPACHFPLCWWCLHLLPTDVLVKLCLYIVIYFFFIKGILQFCSFPLQDGLHKCVIFWQTSWSAIFHYNNMIDKQVLRGNVH